MQGWSLEFLSVPGSRVSADPSMVRHRTRYSRHPEPDRGGTIPQRSYFKSSRATFAGEVGHRSCDRLVSYCWACSRQPTGSGIGAVMGHCIEGNGRAWGGFMNSVDDGFE
jgi:hypothetical protein